MNIDTKNDENNLDTSWIIEYEKMNNIENNITFEPLPQIQLYFFYINSQNCVEKVICKTHDFTDDKIDNDGCSHFSKENIFYIIENHKIFNSKNYNLTDLCLFSIDNIQPTNLINFIKNTNSQFAKYYKTVSIFNDIVISPSIFALHSSSSLFFFFTERHHKHSIRVKSILKKKKTARQAEHNGKQTKKAHFAEDK